MTGSRDWDDSLVIEDALFEAGMWSSITPTIVHGACPRGADAIADALAPVVGYYVERHPADWGTYGKSAGFRRNAEMVNLGADVCLAFIKNGSRGASHTADLAEKAGIPTRRFTA